jgi:hypothetical protein
VPACAADASRVHVGAEPDTRKVPVGADGAVLARRAGLQPYAQGYFSPYAAAGCCRVLMGAVMFGGFGGWGRRRLRRWRCGGDSGWDGGDSGSAVEGADAGGDAGGGDFAGGDWGGGGFGGDFGGGDF